MSLISYKTAFPVIPRTNGIANVTYSSGPADSVLVKFVAKEKVASTLNFTGLQATDAEKDAGAGGALTYENGRRVLVVSTGPSDKKVTADALRKSVTSVVNKLRGLKQKSVTFELFTAEGITSAKIAEVIAQSAILANYCFDRYLTKEDKAPTLLESVAIQGGDDAEVAKAVETATALAQCTVFARDLGNERADEMHPERLHEVAQSIATECGYDIHAVVGEELVKEGLHMLYSVGQAARFAPRYIELVRKGDPENPNDVILLVGKGVTFDTGGLNLKPTGSMEEMHMDMCGSAAVLGAARAAHLLNIKRNIVFVVAVAENAMDSTSYKPYNIIKSHKGITVENGNCDAEGRLCLGDALSLAQQRHRPHTIVDFATLTGACVIALGEYAAGLFTNNKNLADSLVKAGTVRGERAWPMPILEEHRAELVSGTPFADIKSTGAGRYGGACTAAAFLENFIGYETKKEGDKTETVTPAWAHIDIAGPAMYSADRGYMKKGATGFAVQLITEYLRTAPAGAPPTPSE